jgi:hypothetical protein
MKNFSLNSKLIVFLENDKYARPPFQKWRDSAIAFMDILPFRDRYRYKLYRFIKPTESVFPNSLSLALLFGFSKY